MISLTRKQVREVDRIAIEKYHIPGIILMENAARGATDVAAEMVDPSNGQVLVLCGGGNNGGDGLGIARHLCNRGYDVTIGLCTDPANYRGDALINWQIVQAMKMEYLVYREAFQRVDEISLIVDAIFGTGLSEAPRPPFDDIVQRISDKLGENDLQILAVDVPSGLDCDTGLPLGRYCVGADQTATFVARKTGFDNSESRDFTGPVTVVDIGCPRAAIDEAWYTAK
jgi:NAD(P)H-hydrate epimerase